MRLLMMAPVALIALVWGSAPLRAAPVPEKGSAGTRVSAKDADPKQQKDDLTEDTKTDDIARRFAGSTLSMNTGANLNVFVPGLQQTRNPTVDSRLFFAPRYAFREDLSLGARIGFELEWTNSDWTQRVREPKLSDLIFDLGYTGLPDLFFGTKPRLGARLLVPTSDMSRAATMLPSPGISAGLARPFEGVLGGTVTLDASGMYMHNFFSSSTGRVDGDFPYARQCFGGSTNCVNQLGGEANVHDVLAWTLSASGQWGIVTPTVMLQISHRFPYAFRDLEGVARDPERPSVRMGSYLSAGVEVAMTPWMTGQFGYSLGRNLISGSGGYGNPLFDRYQDMRLNLGLSMSLDRFYSALAK